ncbi:PBP domain containing protein [Asbolus verrucosus]|uniref:PBP domain containing protein n=1 Tax=Asbolus verrucosus TaxID=1661398 RepID=A0A482W236_ASBVE|nr:PBP domain containing protein [Asbolus verrucosus]
MTLEAKFKNEEIVPDVIDQAPKSTLQVAFGANQVSLGGELTPTQVKYSPLVSWEVEEGSHYTLIFTDPDAPSRANPIRREFLHWLVVNIPGSDLSQGQVLAEYLSSAPPKDSGLHRYTFLVYKQAKRVDFEEKSIPDTTREGRRHFSARKFSEKYGFGHPVAGNFYLAQWDEYVEEVNKKLAGT